MRTQSALAKWLAFSVLLVGQTAIALDLTILNIAVPVMTADINPTPDQQLWIIDVYSLAVAGLLFTTSSLSDRIGRKTMFLMGNLVFGVGSLMILFGSSPLWVIACRAVMGVGASMIMPTALSMIRNIFDEPRELALATAVWATSATAGMAVGPILGGFLISLFSWHAAFLVNLVFVAITLVGGIPLLPGMQKKPGGAWDAIAAALSLTGMVLLLWGVKRIAGEMSVPDARYLAAVAAGLVLCALFVVRCLRSSSPLADLRLLAHKPFLSGILASLGGTMPIAILLFLSSQWLQLGAGLSPLRAGLALLPMAACNIAFAVTAPAIMRRAGVRRSLLVALAVTVLGLVVPFVCGCSMSMAVFMVSSCLVGGGTSYMIAASSAIVMVETPQEKSSSAASLLQVTYDVGNVAAVAVFGSVASVVFRSVLGTSPFTDAGLSPLEAQQAVQTFATAVERASELGLHDVAVQAGQAFDVAYISACVASAVITVILGLAVARLLHRGYSIEESE